LKFSFQHFVSQHFWVFGNFLGKIFLKIIELVLKLPRYYCIYLYLSLKGSRPRSHPLNISFSLSLLWQKLGQYLKRKEKDALSNYNFKMRKEKEKEKASGYPGVLGFFSENRWPALSVRTRAPRSRGHCVGITRCLWVSACVRVAIAVLWYPLSSVLIPTGISSRFSDFWDCRK
jgi:hypothetical protein